MRNPGSSVLRNISFTLLLVTALSAAVLLTNFSLQQVACAGASAPEADVRAVAESLSPPDTSRMFSDIKYLASDELEGRGTGERGGELAGDFIARNFMKAGLKPGGDEADYFQLFEATVGVSIGAGNSLTISFPHAESTYVVEQDFIPFSFSGVGSASGAIAFAGYGISSERYGYDDYAQLSPEGSVALVMRHEPQQQEKEGTFSGTKLTHYSDLRYKATNAREHGASAIIVTTDPLSHPDEEDELLALQSLEGAGDCGLPAIQVKRRIAEAILQAEGRELRKLQLEIDSLLAPRSMPVPSVNISLQVDLSKDRRTVANIIGILEPSHGEVSEYVVVGAHFDHLGRASQFSLTKEGGIHNGADDNASGTAGVLELVRMFASRRELLKRGIVFMGFNGEELGVLGSTHYVNNPVVPLEKTVFMLNLDSIGRMRDNKLYVAGTGSSPILNELVTRANEELSLTIERSEGGFGPSDHFPFYGSDVPVLFFFTGAHEDYHKVTDDWEKINIEGLATVVELAALTLSELVFTETPIPFTRAAPDTAGPPGGEGYGGGRGAYFGIVPDFGGEPDEGARISGVSEASPAERAGLEAGDIIVEFAGKNISGLHDLSYAIKDKKPGDEVEVVVIRAGERITFRTKLARRGARR